MSNLMIVLVYDIKLLHTIMSILKLKDRKITCKSFCSCHETEFLQRLTPRHWKSSRQSGGMTGTKGTLSSLKATHVEKHEMGNKICKLHVLVSISNNSTRPCSLLGMCNLKDLQKSPRGHPVPFAKRHQPQRPLGYDLSDEFLPLELQKW